MHDPDMPRKRGRIVVYVIPLIILTIFLLRERSPFGGKNTSFAIAPQSKISKIDLNDGSKRVILEKKGDDWLVDGKFEARKNAILFMLKIFEEIKIKSPVSQGILNDEIAKNGIPPVRVRIFQGRKLIKSFIVYRTSSNSYGNIMKMRTSSKPYIVSIPGIETDIGASFSTDELYWLPYTVFNLLPSQIARISLENESDKGNSFSISISGTVLSLKEIDKDEDLIGWDTARVKRYITYFTHVPYESPASEITVTERDEIEKSVPAFTLSVIKTDGKIISVILWEKWSIENGTRKKDTDRIWAKISDRAGLFILRYMDIDPILKKRSYFFPS